MESTRVEGGLYKSNDSNNQTRLAAWTTWRSSNSPQWTTGEKLFHFLKLVQKHGSNIRNVILRNIHVFKNPKEYSHITDHTGNKHLLHRELQTRTDGIRMGLQKPPSNYPLCSQLVSHAGRVCAALFFSLKSSGSFPQENTLR